MRRLYTVITVDKNGARCVLHVSIIKKTLLNAILCLEKRTIYGIKSCRLLHWVCFKWAYTQPCEFPVYSGSPDTESSFHSIKNKRFHNASKSRSFNLYTYIFIGCAYIYIHSVRWGVAFKSSRTNVCDKQNEECVFMITLRKPL